MPNPNQDLAIDVEKIVAARNYRVPKFIVRWIKNFIHQDYINSFLVKGYEGVEFCTECIKYLDVKIDVEGLENLELIPEGAGVTLASNHPLGGVDGVAEISIFGQKFPNLVFPVNDFLMFLKGLAPMCVPVSKMGGQSRSLPAQIAAAFESDRQVLIFPAGICSRKIDGKIQDPAWKKTFITKSVATGRYIVPVHFEGVNSKRFYRVDALRKFFKIKLNLAMFCLPDELCRSQHKTYKMKIGKPIAPEFFDKSRNADQWAQYVRDLSYSL